MFRVYVIHSNCARLPNFFLVGVDDYSGLESTQAKTNAPISRTSSEDLKLELKTKLGQLQEEISKASLPVSADLCNNYKSIILETDQRKIYLS